MRSPAGPAAVRFWTWLTLLLGAVLPWATALGVRTWLAWQGRPVMSWAWVARSLPWFVLLTPLFAMPFILIAIVARLALWRLSATPTLQGALAGLTAVACVAVVRMHVALWWNVEGLEYPILMPVWFTLMQLRDALPGLAAGALLGWIAGRLGQRRSRRA